MSCFKLTSRRKVKMNLFFLTNRELGLRVFVKMSINFKINQSSKKNSVANSSWSITAQNYVHLYTQLLEMCKNTWNKVRYTGGSLHCGLNRLALNFQECLFYTQCPTNIYRVCFWQIKDPACMSTTTLESRYPELVCRHIRPSLFGDLLRNISNGNILEDLKIEVLTAIA